MSEPPAQPGTPPAATAPPGGTPPTAGPPTAAPPAAAPPGGTPPTTGPPTAAPPAAAPPGGTAAGGTAPPSGADLRRTVLGDAHCDRTEATATWFTAPFYDYVTRTAWQQVWARPGLDLRTRSLLTLALLAGLRCEAELGMHVAAALRLGVSVTEIRETLLHATVYAGAPAGNAAFAVAARVLAEHGVALPDHPDPGAAGAPPASPGGSGGPR